MAPVIRRSIFGLAMGVSALYLIDLAMLRLRHDPTATVTVRPYTVVPRNDKREEILFDDPRDESCVNSLLPHQGMTPCWYLRRHPEIKNKL